MLSHGAARIHSNSVDGPHEHEILEGDHGRSHGDARFVHTKKRRGSRVTAIPTEWCFTVIVRFAVPAGLLETMLIGDGERRMAEHVVRPGVTRDVVP